MRFQNKNTLKFLGREKASVQSLLNLVFVRRGMESLQLSTITSASDISLQSMGQQDTSIIPRVLNFITSSQLKSVPDQIAPTMEVAPAKGPSATLTAKQSKKKKVEPRKPYKLYLSEDNIEIYVGRSAAENDIISLSSEYCHDDDWWLHVANYPGSHVIIKKQDDNLQFTSPKTLYDAAILATHFSKGTNLSTSDVTLSRGKYISKNRHDPPGRVIVKNIIETIRIPTTSKKYQISLQRLLEQQNKGKI